jgi:hypothetical protein
MRHLGTTIGEFPIIFCDYHYGDRIDINGLLALFGTNNSCKEFDLDPVERTPNNIKTIKRHG